MPIMLCLDDSTIRNIERMKPRGNTLDLDDDSINWEHVDKLVRVHFLPKDHATMRNRLQAIKFPVSDSWIDSANRYVAAYDELLADVKDSPVDPSFKAIRKTFLDNLRPQFLKEELEARDPEDYNTMVDFVMDFFEKYSESACEQFERLKSSSANRANRNHQRQKDTNNNRASTNGTNGNSSAQSSSSSSKKSQGEKKPPSSPRPSHKGLSCHHCGEKGHIRSFCPTKSQKSPVDNSGRVKPEVRTIRISAESTTKHTTSSVETPTDIGVKTISQPIEDLPKVPVKLLLPQPLASLEDGVPAKASWDSMSNLNIIRRDLLHKLTGDIQTTRIKPISATVYGDQCVKFDEEINLLIQVQASSLALALIPISFVVTDDKSAPEVLVGFPFQRANLMTDVSKLLDMEIDHHSLRVTNLQSESVPKDLRQESYYNDPALDAQVASVIQKYPAVFDLSDTSPSTLEPFPLDLEDDVDQNLRFCPPRRFAPPISKKIEAEVEKLLELDIIEPSTSPHSAPVVPVAKPFLDAQGKPHIRLCVDFSKLNAFTRRIVYPTKAVMQTILMLADYTIFCRLDQYKAFHQIFVREEHRDYLSFSTNSGHYRYKRMPFGVRNGTAHYQRMMDWLHQKLPPDIKDCVIIFVDDIVIGGKDVSQYLTALDAVLSLLQEYNLALNLDKCNFNLKSVEYLGYVIEDNQYRHAPHRMKAIANVVKPKSTAGLRSFLGLANTFKNHVKDFAKIASPLYALNGKRKNFEWTAEHDEAFIKLRDAIVHSNCLTMPTDESVLVLRTDASDIGCAGALYDVKDSSEGQPIHFVSTSFDRTQQNWSVTEKECYGIIFSVKRLSDFLAGRLFTIETDHRNLIFMQNSKVPKIARWRMELADFDYVIRHIRGTENVVADSLSRLLPRILENSSSTTTPGSSSATSTTAPGSSSATSTTAPGSSSATSTTAPGSSSSTSATVHATNAVGPMDLKDLFHNFHNSTIGHWGAASTVELMRAAGHTLTQENTDSISGWIQSCAHCQKLTGIQGPVVARVKSTSVSSPFEYLILDALGPFQEDSAGNTYIITIMDCFTRYVELFPVPSNDAHHFANCLLSIVGSYGYFKEIRSDQGSNFVANIIERLCKMMNIEQRFGLAYRPQSQGTVERSHRETLRHLRSLCLTHSARDNWSAYLPLVKRLMNCHRNRVTGIAPAQLLYGGAVDLNRNLFVPNARTIANEKPKLKKHWHGYLADLLLSQDELIKAAAASQEKHVERYLATSPKQLTEYAIGDFVLVSYPERPPSKLHPKWRGPFEIVDRQGDVYYLHDLVATTEGPPSEFHVSRLMPYRSDDTLTPLEVAMMDNDMYIAEKIVKHRGPIKKKTDMEFLVKWQNYPASENNWEPYRNVKHLQVFKDYCRTRLSALSS
jgi:transposase InsO family protein